MNCIVDIYYQTDMTKDSLILLMIKIPGIAMIHGFDQRLEEYAVTLRGLEKNFLHLVPSTGTTNEFFKVMSSKEPQRICR